MPYQILVSAELVPHDQNPLESSTMENIIFKPELVQTTSLDKPQLLSIILSSKHLVLTSISSGMGHSVWKWHVHV